MCRPGEAINEYMTVREIAEQMHSSDDTVRRMIEQGELETVKWNKTYRIKRSSFQTYLETHRVGKVNGIQQEEQR